MFAHRFVGCASSITGTTIEICPAALLYDRIMVSSILNLVIALTACGMFAGSVIVSPCLTL
jgi:hypothetical protein